MKKIISIGIIIAILTVCCFEFVPARKNNNNDISLDSILISNNIHNTFAPNRDVLIIDDLNKRAFFGWYRSSFMTPENSYPDYWNLLRDTIDWAVNFAKPWNTKIILFTYDGTVDPNTAPDGAAVYDFLINIGYLVTVLHQQQAEIKPIAYYNNYDLVIYWNSYGYSGENIVRSDIPFISVAVTHAASMGIGNGDSTLHEHRDSFCIIDNSYHPTSDYSLGCLTLAGPLWTDGTQATGNGIVLVNVPYPKVEITKPLPGNLHFDDTIFFNIGSSDPIVIGLPSKQISIDVEATPEGCISKVDFYIDNVHQFSDNTYPYSWAWTWSTFDIIPKNYDIKVISHGSCTTDTDTATITVLKWL